MRDLRRFRLAAVVVAGTVVLALGPLDVRGGSSGQPEPVAIVASLSGTARVKPRGGPARELGLFDRLPVGATIDVSPRSAVIIAFATGHRFQLDDGGRAKVAKEGLENLHGAVRSIAPVPAFVKIPPVRNLAGARTAALRVRGGMLGQLYPREGAAVMAHLAVLSFSSPPEAGECTVEVLDTAANTVSKTVTAASPVALAPGLLTPGQRYEWRVRCETASGVMLRADARFATVPLDMTEARQAFQAAALADAPSLGLLAEIDQGLGLLREARAGFREALARDPGNAALAAALDRVNRWMDDGPR